MKKDYAPVVTSDFALSETSFVEEYWTRVWDATDQSAFSEAVEGREEFGLMSPYVARLPPGSRLLDGGCGLGEWTQYFATRGFDVVGLDLSKATIEKLSHRYPGTNFVVGDIRNTSFEDNSFAAYFSWGAFEHFEEGLGAPLREARRILVPGGYLFISVPFQNLRHALRDRRQLYRWDENYSRENGYRSEIRFYQWRLSRPELQRELEMHGFKTLEIASISKSQGVLGLVKYDLHIRPDSKIGIVAQTVLRQLLPKDLVAHMIVGIARKV